MIKYVVYKRVSTKKQGKSGLGLEAQERDIKLFLENYSGQPYEVIKEFVDVESGTNNDRPELAKAIELAKKQQAILLVAKLDRLSRTVSFIASLMEDKKFEFKVACMPEADEFQLHIYAALAQQERKFIAVRTKQALAEAKARGKKLGGLRDKTGERNKAIQKAAFERAKALAGVIRPMRKDGMSMQAIANELNSLGYQTARGGEFTAMQVKRTIDRLEKESAGWIKC